MSHMKDMYTDEILYNKEMSEPYDYREYIILEIVNHINYKNVFDILWESIYKWDPEESMVYIINVLENKTYEELTLIYKELKW